MTVAARLVACVTLLGVFSLASQPAVAQVPTTGDPWPMHVIDDSSRGADGVRLADVNGDALPDVATGWEEGGITRVYLHPGHGKVNQPWPAVTVGKTPSVEDAVFVDLDADGRTDVVSSCEGRTRTMFVHWAPGDPKAYLDPTAWKTEPIPTSIDRQAWMFCLPMQVDARHGIDLVAAGKGGGAEVGWFEAPAKARDLAGWQWHAIAPAGWVMSLIAADVDADGDRDVLTTDRKGPHRGVRWLEHPGSVGKLSKPWTNRVIGGADREVMFMNVADLDGDRADDLLVAVKPSPLLFFRRQAAKKPEWQLHEIPMPDGIGTGKGVAVGDVDGNGAQDVVFSCENAKGDLSGVIWLGRDAAAIDGNWTAHQISGPTGIKFDRIELLDLDGDGDLDLMTCEESQPVDDRRHGLGVIWYENPAIQ